MRLGGTRDVTPLGLGGRRGRSGGVAAWELRFDGLNMDVSEKAGATVWPPVGPQLLRAYGRASEFRRHAAQLASAGWVPMEVTTRQAPLVLRALNVASLGLLSLLTPLEPSLHVTYAPRVD